jgi:hypothetical protein
MLDPEVVEAAYDDAVATDNYVHKAAVGMSMIGGCRRQAAYALRDGWPDEPGSGSATAYLGTAIHDRLLPDLADRLGGQVEPEVWTVVEGIEIVGHPDLVLDEGECLDLKTVSQWYYETCKRRVPWEHRLQVTAGALATDSIGCCLLYVNRSDGARFAVSWDIEEYTGDLMEWVRQIQVDPNDAPRDERGPVLSWKCDQCPWVKQCWGPLDEFRAPQSIVADEIGIEMALEEYDAARQIAADAKKDQEFWRQVLDGSESGPYGIWELGWTGGGGPIKDTPDYEAAWEWLEETGGPLPYKRGKPKKPSISVKRRTQD